MTNSEFATILLTGSSSSIWKRIPSHSKKKARRKFLKGLRGEATYSLGPHAIRLRELFSDGPEGMLLWLNLACFTFNPRLPPGSKHPPFFTWEVQERAAAELWRAIDEGRDVLIDKSRDMGATWLCLAAFAWWWLFVPDTPMLVASRKEEYVDARGNPDTLFWKLEYLLANQPPWLRPPVERRHMHLRNMDSGSVIDGESTNADLGRGGRRKAIMLDEFAAVDNGAEILAATADAAPCRIYNSTPQGRGNAFADVRFSGKVKVVTLHWKDHPVKGEGARQVQGAGDCRLTIVDCRLPTASEPQHGIRNLQSTICNLQSPGRWTSPWYEAECARRTSRKEIAQELDIDYLASGDAFFDLDVLAALRAGGAGGPLRPPLAWGELRFRVSTVEEGAFYRLFDVEWLPEGGRRRLSLWCPLTIADFGLRNADFRKDESSDGGNPQSEIRNPQCLRPRQDRNYVAFADVAHGTGASNSVIKVADASTREEAASFSCPDISPHELARYAVALCLWFGGRRPCLLGWEANGPGGIFGSEVHKLGYGAVLGGADPAATWRPQSGVGWQSSREKKQDLLGDLRRALARGELVIHDEATVTELEQYIYYPSGAVGPSGLVQEVEGARAAHGDRVIAAAGLLLCLAQQPGAGARGGTPPAGSFADRREEARRAGDESARWAE